jgi:hypothetical protein
MKYLCIGGQVGWRERAIAYRAAWLFVAGRRLLEPSIVSDSAQLFKGNIPNLDQPAMPRTAWPGITVDPIIQRNIAGIEDRELNYDPVANCLADDTGYLRQWMYRQQPCRSNGRLTSAAPDG